MPLKESAFQLKKGILVASIIRGKDVIIPDGNSSMQAGDTVIVVTNSSNVLKEIDDIFAV